MISVTAPWVDDRANAACIEFFAEAFKVPRSSVTIAAGEKSRNKVLWVTGIIALAAGRGPEQETLS